jgi:hypothetical protein
MSSSGAESDSCRSSAQGAHLSPFTFHLSLFTSHLSPLTYERPRQMPIGALLVRIRHSEQGGFVESFP